ncbi:GntR family transcriptional regulator [Nocardia farcinica]|uniref:GntR family transcriptional regulator n=1 Tax=Nocardia farcinica TaxID=37329 RepID=UPI001895EBE6|nr:GntR family transcriptional regulator [Nocardia farcinica]MBF6234815.1 GntR family transcriptional regulator [Nocardia farcinica]MBF6422536.1 GntR family transcriptional regulator [Nocardia farcinica]MBF6434307.1 GntR family transcriptional regulator [Nocardia farcinica]MBF6505391.1 GntR family transcriptional regulator [Nocardia farcinica]
MSKRPRWKVIYDDLREQITSGALQPGDKIPTELELADRYSFSRPTVREAIRRLEQEGLLTAAIAGIGRTVRSRDLITWHLTKFELGAYSDDPVNMVDQWEADAHADGWSTRQVVASVAELPATAQVAQYLQCRPGTLLLRRRRLRYVTKPQVPEQLAMIADTWTPLDIANMEIDGVAPLRTESNVVYPGGIYRALGFRQTQFCDEITVRMPEPDESELLDQQPGTPVGQHARVGIDATGRRVRVLLSVFSGDALRLRYDLNVPENRPATNGAATRSERTSS